MAELPNRRAPGRLEAVRAFVNTLDIEAGRDALAGPSELAEHLVAWHLLAPDRSLGASDLRAAIELRESLRMLLGAHNGLQTQGVWTRLKACSSDTCRWAYYDASRNRASRWCHMQVCGNRAKGQTFRARHAGIGPAPLPR